MRISPLEFNSSKIGKDTIDFIEEAYRIITVIGVPSEEKVKLVAHYKKFDLLQRLLYGNSYITVAIAYLLQQL